MQFRHPVLDQRLRLTVRRRGGCWQLRGNLGRWCGPRMNLGNYGAEGLARQVGAKLGQALADSGVVRWWSPLNLWVEAVSESIHWDNAGQRETLEGLCPLWVRRGEGGKYLHLFGISVHLSPITAHLAASAIWRDYWDARLREQIDSLKASRFADKVILRKLTGWQCRWSDGRAVGMCDVAHPFVLA